MGQTLDGVLDSAGTITGTKDIGFGANIVLSSNDGTRILVGAYNNTAVDGTGTDVEEGGAVFLYDYDGVAGTWIYKTHWVGDSSEELGRWPISISADGQLVAIRRGSAMRPAEVWNVTDAGVKTKLGSDITCADAGNMLALTETNDGTTRLAAACEFDGAEESGNVNVYDWNGTEWVAMSPSLSVDTSGTTDGLFGFDISWALNGTRLAVSAPNFYATVGEEGLVAVFEHDGSTWNQLGQNLTGTQPNEKFGFTMELSSDGNTLVVGSPNKDVGGLTDSGAVRVYSLNTTTDMWDLQQEIAGEEIGDKFGRGVNVNNDGSLLCASSHSHNGNRGQVRVFEFSGSWTQVAEFEGSDSGDLLGFNNMGVDMTTDGSRIAMAASHAQTNGIVQVFDDGYTPAPTASPAPSHSPSLGPSDSVIEEDGMMVETFDWDIFPLPDDTQVVFSEDADTSEVVRRCLYCVFVLCYLEYEYTYVTTYFLFFLTTTGTPLQYFLSGCSYSSI